jgi:Ca2+-binding RTX toxin-like protein
MTSISPINNNSTALTLLRTATQTKASGPSQSAASQILASMIPTGKDPMQMAEGTISRILFGSGQIITGASFSDVKGSDGNDIIRTGAGSSVDGGAGDDDIEAGPSSSVSGGAGNDHIVGSSYSNINGDDGDDSLTALFTHNTVNGGGGNDQIDAISFGNRLNGGAGNDTITVLSDNSVDGGDGDDTIVAGPGSTINGGTGNDTIQLSGGPRTGPSADLFTGSGSTVTYSAGDGKDTLSLQGGASTLKLGDGLTSANTHISVSGNKAIISFDGNEGDQITINLGSQSSLAVTFGDGTTQNIDWDSDPAAAIKSPLAQKVADQLTALSDRSVAVPNSTFSAYLEH